MNIGTFSPYQCLHSLFARVYASKCRAITVLVSRCRSVALSQQCSGVESANGHSAKRFVRFQRNGPAQRRTQPSNSTLRHGPRPT